MKRPVDARFDSGRGVWDLWYLDSEEWCGATYSSKDAAELAAIQVRVESRGDGPSDIKPRGV